MSAVADAAERDRAIDPLASFCVSAPAGSGKTELLIQRYLGLLSRVQRPEQVLAITFTRKAAAEMRERVMQALREAAEGIPVASAHQGKTRALAQDALAADSRLGWRLVSDVSRLNIKTIDSFCLSLTRQMPVLSLFGGQATPVDDANALYEEAVDELFAMLDSRHAVTADLRALLGHFHNDWERVRTLLVNMLGRRSQWALYIGVRDDPGQSERYLVAAVEQLVRDELTALSTLFQVHRARLLELMQYAAANLGQPVPEAFPGSELADIGLWRALRNMLLTSEGRWRKKPNKLQGFPAKGSSEEAALRLEQVAALLVELAELEGAEDALNEVALLPEMGAGQTSWRLVVHLAHMLPILAAQLLLVFRRRGAVDHTQVAQSALAALGDDDAPTDLALRLDYRIEHLLVDEFQDTSVNQFELIRKLTRGWPEHNAANPQNPRTLMIVGDAMQSIYGFRDANVGLFFRARDEGFDGLPLEHVQLQCNFRSDAAVIEWVNQTFQRAFPAVDDISTAQVKYSPATAVRPSGQGAAVELHGFVGEDNQDAEVGFICDAIERQVCAGETGIAVLGRQRKHLQLISARLKSLGVPFQAQELDSLSASPVVSDLLNLCYALANDADRVAWLALLRAPWAGLALPDLLTVAKYNCVQEQGRGEPIFATLCRDDMLSLLSDEGAVRVAHLRSALSLARAKRDRLALRAWIELAWISLGGPAAAAVETDLEDAESFLRLLEQADSLRIGFDPAWLEERVERQYMSGGDPDCPVQLMTLHKAKGLEFDRVYIPRLNGVGRGNERELLRWDEHSDAHGNTTFLLAANDMSDSDSPSLYHYLGELGKRKQRREATRLMYVGATRAVRQLHLSAGINWDEKKDVAREPPAGSLLATIWPAFRSSMQLHETEQVPGEQERQSVLRRLARDSLPCEYLQPASLPRDNFPERADNHFERTLGTVVHLALEELSALGELPERAVEADMCRWRSALQEGGLHGETLANALARLREAIDTTLADREGGRWLLDSGHLDARSEWALTCVGERFRADDRERGPETPGNLIIDRCFIDKDSGERWIVDYKTSGPADGETEQAFLEQEVETYRDQLRRYREAVSELCDEPVRCALYFTSLGRLHELRDLGP